VNAREGPEGRSGVVATPTPCERDGVVWYETGGEGWRAAFSTRLGGVSPAPFASLNLSLSTEDDPERVRCNRRRLAAALGIDAAALVVPGQVHGTTVAQVGPAERGRGARDRADLIRDTDGLLTTEPRLPLVVSVADCVPVVLVAGRPARAIAAVHAGWRGMVVGIVGEAARALGAYGAVRAAVVGPSIGPCCFAVSSDVGEAFEERWPGTWRDGRVDLWETARRQLVAAGVAAENVVTSGLCTCHDERFFSHRREHGVTGRQAAIAWITGGTT
jgi:hypothetical protein